MNVKNYRNLLTKLIDNAKNRYFKEELSRAYNDPKKLWKQLKSY